MDVYLPAGRHWLHTDVAITIFVSISTYMTMVVVVMLHRHFEHKAWRTMAGWLACRKHTWDCKLRKKYNQQKRKNKFLDHLDLL